VATSSNSLIFTPFYAILRNVLAKPLIQVFEETRCDCVVGAAKVKDPSR
jgi:hypothetical protein